MLRGFGVRGRGRVRRLLQLQWGPGAAAVTAIRQLNCPRPWKEPGFWELPPAGLGMHAWIHAVHASMYAVYIHTWCMHPSQVRGGQLHTSAAAGRRWGGDPQDRGDGRTAACRTAALHGIWRPRPDPSAHACVSCTPRCAASLLFCWLHGADPPTTMRGRGRGRSDGFEVSAAGAGDASSC